MKANWEPDEVRRNRDEEIREVTDFIKAFIDGYEYLDRNSKADPGMDEVNEKRLRSIEINEYGRPLSEIGEEIKETVFKTSQYVPNSKYMAYVPNSASPYSVAGAVMSETFNIYAGASLFSPGSAIIEKKLISWMGSLIGYDRSCGGLFTSGGSMSNLTGMIAARNTILSEDDWPIGTAYYSDQTHSSIKKGMMLMGMRSSQKVVIPSDDDFKIRLDLLEEAIKKDIADGKKPFLIVGNLGATNTGSIDPFREMAEIAHRYGMWLHVDGAYGGSILLSDTYRYLADGLSLADSFTWDQHKWAMQTYTCSCIIAKDRKNLIRTFVEHPEYLDDIQDSAHVDGWDLGIEMTRPARAMKLWVTLQALGTKKVSDVIDRTIHTMGVAEELIGVAPGWEITSPSMCGAVTFRYAPEYIDESRLNALNTEIAARLNEETDAYLATTVIKGMKVIRICVINSSITDRDVKEVVEDLKRIAVESEKSYM